MRTSITCVKWTYGSMPIKIVSIYMFFCQIHAKNTDGLKQAGKNSMVKCKCGSYELTAGSYSGSRNRGQFPFKRDAAPSSAP